MKCEKQDIELRYANTTAHCPSGEAEGKRGMQRKRIPVLSCEGACIRGEIARQAANRVARQSPFGRGCHGELLAVPDSAIARWIKTADQVVLIDGCFLRCHGRILEGLLGAERLVQFDALSVYKRYTDIFDVDDVAEPERLATARQVADHVLRQLRPEKGNCDDDAGPQGSRGDDGDARAGTGVGGTGCCGDGVKPSGCCG